MKRRKFLKTLAITGAGFAYMPNIFGQDSTTAVSNVGEDLDLYGVLDLFAEAENLEEFEKALNDEEQGINNLDLNGNGEVEYIKVDEIVEGNTHLIILQVEIEENEFQDVATIEIEKKSDDDYSLQIIGVEELYGENYIIEPVTEASSTTTTVVHVHTYPTVVVMYSPAYTPWVSPWRWSVRPIWWRPFRPIARSRRKTVRRSRYRKTTRRRSSRGRSMHSSRKKTSNRYKKSSKKTTNKKQTSKKQTNKKQTNKKQTTNKKTTTSKNKTTTSKKGTTSQQKKNSNATKKKR